jgi:diacylglycerol O-acyltransferase
MSMTEDGHAAAAREWGADRHMTPFESLMFRTEVNPLLRSTGVLMELLEGPPERERLIAAHEWGTRLLPRLRQRVVEDPLGLASPRWAVGSDFDLAYHLRFVSLPEPGSIDQVLELAQVLAMAPFDRARPLWEAVLVEGLAEGKAAYLLKLHHSITDGQGTVQMMDLLHSDKPEPGRARHLPLPAPERISGRGLAARNLLSAPSRMVRGVVHAGGLLAETAGRVASRPVEIVDGLGYVRSLGRMLGGAPAPGAILLEQRGLGRRFGIMEVPLADLRAAGKAAGGSLNDAFLAGLTGGVRRYHEHHGVEVDEITLALPISLRKSDDPLGSNRFAGARIGAPVRVSDPRERIRIIGAQVREARDEPALGFMDMMAPALSRLPGVLSASMTERVTRSIDLQASNVPGLTRAAYIAGARVLKAYPFGAAPGPAVMVTLLSYNGTCCIGVAVNAAAVPDHELFVRCMEEGLAEVTALAPSRPEPVPETATDGA